MPKQATREQQAVADAVTRLHRQLGTTAFAEAGVLATYQLPATSTFTGTHPLGKRPRGAVRVEVPSAAPAQFHIISWDEKNITIESTGAAATVALRLF